MDISNIDSLSELEILIGTKKGDKDILSTFHENNIKHEERKKLGQFYTHQALVKYIFSKIPITDKSKILDPSVGAGAFLISALTFNSNNYQNLYGIDIDNNALGLCVQNINVNSGSVNRNNFKCSNTINSELWELFPEIYQAGGFDIVIGNPPYQHLLAHKDFSPNYEIFKPVLNGVANSATLMIAKGLQFLKDGGYLGFVLPKGILRVDSFSGLRKFLGHSVVVKDIFDLGHYFKDVRGDQIILILQKLRPATFNNKISVSIHKKNLPLDQSTNYTLTQKDLLKYDFYPIYRTKSLTALADKLFSIPLTLEAICDGNIFRGLNLSSKDNSISKEQKSGLIKIFRGDSISKFGIKYCLFLDLSKIKNDKAKRERLSTEKIILQNLCSKEAGITATLSGADELNIDTVTNVVCDKLDLKFLLGILNSNLSNFFLLHIMFLSSNFTMHTDRQYIGQLPIVLPRKNVIRKVSKIVEAILLLKGEKGSEYQLLYCQLNKLVYEIYDLDKNDIKIIETCLKETLSKRQLYVTENE